MREEDFLARVQALGGLASREEAERWSTTVLRGLVHLLGAAETRRHFLSQLPGVLKAALLAEPPRALLMDADSFLQHVASALGVHAPDGERAVRVVYGVLKEAVSPGQIAELEAHMPKDIAARLGKLA